MILNNDETLYNNIKKTWNRKALLVYKTKTNILITSLTNKGKEY